MEARNYISLAFWAKERGRTIAAADEGDLPPIIQALVQPEADSEPTNFLIEDQTRGEITFLQEAA